MGKKVAGLLLILSVAIPVLALADSKSDVLSSLYFGIDAQTGKVVYDHDFGGNYMPKKRTNGLNFYVGMDIPGVDF